MGRAKGFKGQRKGPRIAKPPLTHFLCLPLVNSSSRPQLEASLAAFKNDVCPAASSEQESSSSDDGIKIDPKAVRPLGSLHLTLGMMSLKQGELSAATDSLEKLDCRSLMAAAASEAAPNNTAIEASGAHTSAPDIYTTPEPLKVHLRGLESMHSPQNTSILYAAPDDPTMRLSAFCLALQAIFKEAGFLVADDRPFKLHATIVNTIYAKDRRRQRKPQPKSRASTPDEDVNNTLNRSPTQAVVPHAGRGSSSNASLKFDARVMMERYSTWIWAKDVNLDRVAICEMGAKKTLDPEGNVIDERYSEVATVTLPT